MLSRACADETKQRPKILQYNFLLPTQAQNETFKKILSMKKMMVIKIKTIWGKTCLWNKLQKKSDFFLDVYRNTLKKNLSEDLFVWVPALLDLKHIP